MFVEIPLWYEVELIKYFGVMDFCWTEQAISCNTPWEIVMDIFNVLWFTSLVLMEITLCATQQQSVSHSSCICTLWRDWQWLKVLGKKRKQTMSLDHWVAFLICFFLFFCCFVFVFFHLAFSPSSHSKTSSLRRTLKPNSQTVRGSEV